jgi:uncharacterized protein (TIGR00369 family)
LPASCLVAGQADDRTDTVNKEAEIVVDQPSRREPTAKEQATPAPLPQDVTERLSGLEQLRAIRDGELGVAPMHARMNMRLVEVEDGRVVFAGAPDEGHLNPQGTVHAAWATAMLDSAMGCAVITRVGAGTDSTTLELKLNLVRPLTPGTEVVAEGVVVHSGRRIATAEGRLAGVDGKLFAHATTTCMILG